MNAHEVVNKLLESDIARKALDIIQQGDEKRAPLLKAAQSGAAKGEDPNFQKILDLYAKHEPKQRKLRLELKYHAELEKNNVDWKDVDLLILRREKGKSTALMGVQLKDGRKVYFKNWLGYWGESKDDDLRDFVKPFVDSHRRMNEEQFEHFRDCVVAFLDMWYNDGEDGQMSGLDPEDHARLSTTKDAQELEKALKDSGADEGHFMHFIREYC